jgi:RNA recognition motif-containing protein
MGKKLYVGNLPYSTTDASLAEVFAQVGKVESAKVVMDRETGRSRGFGFVEMSTDAEAADAVSRLHGVEYDGRAMTVTEARSQEAGAGRAGAGGRGGFGGGGRGRY